MSHQIKHFSSKHIYLSLSLQAPGLYIYQKEIKFVCQLVLYKEILLTVWLPSFPVGIRW